MIKREVIIREAETSDAKDLLNLLNQVSYETDYIILDNILSLRDIESFLDSRAESPNEICLLVLVDGILVGILNIISMDTDNVGDLFIAIRKDYWGYGLAHYLMDMALDWANHTVMIKCIKLTVQMRNTRAIHLYEKFGFKIEDTKKRGAKTKDGEFLDIYIMSRLID